MSIFGGPETTAAAPAADALPDLDELPDAELLKFEKELLGFYITSHPLTEHQAILERYTTASTKEAMACGEGTEVTIGGMISRVKKSVTKNGRSAGMQMAMVTLEDLDGPIDGVIFAETFAEVAQRYPSAVAAESIVLMKGKVDKRREVPSVIVSEVIPVADAPGRLTTAVCVVLDPAKHPADVLPQVKATLGKHRGATPAFVQVPVDGQTVTIKLGRDAGVRPGRDLQGDVEQLLGNGSLQFHGAGSRRMRRLQQQQLFKDAALPAGDAPVDGETAGDEADTEVEPAS